jgi:hypothetical protein
MQRTFLPEFAAVQLLDVRLPATDGREIEIARYIHPGKDLQFLLHQLQLPLPEQAPPKIQAPVPASLEKIPLLRTGCLGLADPKRAGTILFIRKCDIGRVIYPAAR